MQVTVFHGQGCNVCHDEMEFLSKNGVDFVGKDVTRDAAARSELIALGSKTLPTTVIDGEVIVGFEVDRLRTLLNIH